MLRPLLLAFALSVLPIASSTSASAAGQGASADNDTSEAGYQRDVRRGADLKVQETELTLKFNAGKISGAHYRERLAPIRAEQDQLSSKWSQSVNRRAAVMYTGDVYIAARPRVAALNSRYAPASPPQPVQPQSAPFDPYLAAQARNRPPGEVLTDNIGGIFLASFLGVCVVGVIAILLRKLFGSPEEAAPEKPAVSGNYGTASWQMPSPAMNYMATPATGVFFGKDSHPSLNAVPIEEQWGKPLCSFPKAHTLIVAQTRTGKGTRVIVPTLLRYTGSIVVIDPKGENAAITAATRAQLHPGKTSPVHILNPWGVLDWQFEKLGLAPATFNPLDLIDRRKPRAVSIAQALANTISPSSGNAKDDFWPESAANIIAAVILWVVYQPGETATLARVREITSLPRTKFRADFMLKMAASSAFEGAISELIGPYVDLASDTYTGVMGNVGKALRFMSDPLMKAATATSSFSLADLRREPSTLYIVIPPEQIATHRTWLRLLIASITQFYRSGGDDPKAGPPAHRCMMMIDEFPALGRMPDMPSDLATMAGYGIDYTLVVQGLDQLRHAYDRSANTILSNCAFKWFCNVGDLDTAKYLSETLGKETVQTVGKSENKGWNPGGQSSGESVNFGETGRPLLTPDEVQNLGRDKAIVLYPESRPHYVRTVDYWDLQTVFAHLQVSNPETYWRPPLTFMYNPYHIVVAEPDAPPPA